MHFNLNLQNPHTRKHDKNKKQKSQIKQKFKKNMWDSYADPPMITSSIIALNFALNVVFPTFLGTISK